MRLLEDSIPLTDLYNSDHSFFFFLFPIIQENRSSVSILSAFLWFPQSFIHKYLLIIPLFPDEWLILEIQWWKIVLLCSFSGAKKIIIWFRQRIIEESSALGFRTREMLAITFAWGGASWACCCFQTIRTPSSLIMYPVLGFLPLSLQNLWMLWMLLTFTHLPQWHQWLISDGVCQFFLFLSKRLNFNNNVGEFISLFFLYLSFAYC